MHRSAQALAAEAQPHARFLLSSESVSHSYPTSELRFELRAPLTGYCALSRNATVGQTVSAEHILCDLIDPDRGYFIARSYEVNLNSH